MAYASTMIFLSLRYTVCIGFGLFPSVSFALTPIKEEKKIVFISHSHSVPCRFFFPRSSHFFPVVILLFFFSLSFFPIFFSFISMLIFLCAVQYVRDLCNGHKFESCFLSFWCLLWWECFRSKNEVLAPLLMHLMHIECSDFQFHFFCSFFEEKSNWEKKRVNRI